LFDPDVLQRLALIAMVASGRLGPRQKRAPAR
jgi:hypothetical protein